MVNVSHGINVFDIYTALSKLQRNAQANLAQTRLKNDLTSIPHLSHIDLAQSTEALVLTLPRAVGPPFLLSSLAPGQTWWESAHSPTVLDSSKLSSCFVWWSITFFLSSSGFTYKYVFSGFHRSFASWFNLANHCFTSALDEAFTSSSLFL